MELHELKKKLMEELKEKAHEIAKGGRMTASDLDLLSKLVKTIDRLCEILKEEEGEYSEAGKWDATVRGDYGDSSYQGRNRMGRYTRDGYSRDYSRDSHSMDYSHGGVVEEIERMMANASGREREELRKCAEAMRHM